MHRHCHQADGLPTSGQQLRTRPATSQSQVLSAGLGSCLRRGALCGCCGNMQTAVQVMAAHTCKTALEACALVDRVTRLIV